MYEPWCVPLSTSISTLTSSPKKIKSDPRPPHPRAHRSSFAVPCRDHIRGFYKLGGRPYYLGCICGLFSFGNCRVSLRSVFWFLYPLGIIRVAAIWPPFYASFGPQGCQIVGTWTLWAKRLWAQGTRRFAQLPSKQFGSIFQLKPACRVVPNDMRF